MEIPAENSTHNILYPSNNTSTSQKSKRTRTRPRTRRQRPESGNADDGAGTDEPPLSSDPGQLQKDGNRTRRPPRAPRNGEGSNSGQINSAGLETVSSSAPTPNGTVPSFDARPRNKNPRPPNRPKQSDTNSTPTSTSTTGAKDPNTRIRTRGRGAKFNAGLTDPAHASSNTPPTSSTSKYTLPGPTKDDLTSTLIHGLRTPPYQDCPICFNAIRPEQPTWSCSPSATAGDGHENANAQCCWTTFHLKCIRSWAGKSVKEIVDAWRARGEERGGEWRCPGCQSKREMVPNGYWCFCGSIPEPKPPRLSTPHSCANPCSRSRVCGHPCPLSCHPGPCPPCQITTQIPCHCGRRTMSFKCSHLSPGRFGASSANLCCGNVCGKKLDCKNHECESVCHEGPCGECKVKEDAKCYCGKAMRELRCGEGEEKVSVIESEERWVGRFDCGDVCGRPFDCNLHRCVKQCHPPSSSPPPCPRSSSITTHCPCGKHPISPNYALSFPNNALLSRNSCSDPIPNCTSTCLKPLDGCNHVCSSRCHSGPCPPCTIMVVRPCRCGATTRDVRCYSLQLQFTSPSSSPAEILCDKPCQALRACGRHQCNRLCCPLASLAAVKGKGKKRNQVAVDEGVLDEGGLHECDLICGKMLGCGNHRCDERDHRGMCPPCLRSSFEEMICHCNHTILDPPVPCGTRINCTYPCSRPPPPCGHPSTQHSCHEDPTPCPPCPFLTSKACACGKREMGNVRCSQEKVSCGVVCGKLMTCGFHHCERLCHGDDCGTCTAVCGKSRKSCLPAHHPCPLPCHAPASCSESTPCQSIIALTCPCGRIQLPAQCSRSASSNSSVSSSSKQIKCTNECAIAKRNARLADALGISTETREKTSLAGGVTFGDDLTAYARVASNGKFVALVEKAFAEFVTSDRKTQVLPHMPMDRRKFVHDLAAAYGMDTQMVDQEPHRSVQLIRRIDTRIPNPPLSATVSSGSAGLGKLADMRTSSASRPPPSRSPAPTAGPGSAKPTGSWTSVVARPSSTGTSTPSRTRWSTPDKRPVATQPISNVAQAVTTTPSVDAETLQVPDNWEDDL